MGTPPMEPQSMDFAEVPSRKGMPTWAIVVICLLVGMVVLGCAGVFLLLPALGKARQSARQMKSAMQIRQISAALLMYAQANKEEFPEPGADWQGRIRKYLSDPSVLVAPQAGPGQESYFYVPSRKATDMTSAVLLYENPEINRGAGANVGYQDSTVRWYPAPVLYPMIEGLKLPDGTPYKPPGK